MTGANTIRRLAAAIASGVSKIVTFTTRHPSIFVLLAILWYVGASIDFINFTVDDVFIPMRYAEHAMKGDGLVFNVGERVEGYSNFLWTGMLTLAARAGMNQWSSPYAMLQFAKLTGFAFGLMTIIVAGWLALRIARQSGESTISLFMGLAVVAIPATVSFDVWSVSGMETPMCAFFVTLGAAMYWKGLRQDSQTTDRWWMLAGGLSFGLASLTRPEQMFTWGLATICFLLMLEPRLRRAMLPSILVTVVFIVTFECWRLGYYGELFPNSVIAKSGGGIFTHLDGIRYLLSGLASTLGVAGLGMLLAPRLARRSPQWNYIVMMVGAQLCFVLISSGDWMTAFRFLVPVIPLLCIVAYAGVASLLNTSQAIVRLEFVAVCIVLFAAGTFFSGRRLVRAETNYDSGFKGITWSQSLERLQVAGDLSRMMPAGSLLAMGECGEIPYFLPDVRVFDMLGLMDREVARMPGPHMHALDPSYILQRNADVIVYRMHDGERHLENHLEPELARHYRLTKAYTTLQVYARFQE